MAASTIAGRTPAAGQAVALAAGALVPVFTFLLAAEILQAEDLSETRAGRGPSRAQTRSRVALFAGLLVALTGQLWQSSMVVMADTTGLVAATVSAWSLARYGRVGRLRWLALAALTLALAVLTRWIYGFLVLPWALFLALHAVECRAWQKTVIHASIAALIGAAVLAPELGLAALDFVRSGGTSAAYAGNLQVYSWHPLNALLRVFDTADGRLSYRLPNGLYYALAPAHWLYFTPLLSPLIPFGLWVVARRRAWKALALVGGWAAVVYAFHAGAPWQNFRFTLAYLPPLAILAALGLNGLLIAVGDRRQTWLIAGFAAGLLIMTMGGVRLCSGFVARKNTDLRTVQWIETHAAAGSTLLAFNLTLTLRHYSPLETRELFEQTPGDLQALVAAGRPVYLLVDVDSMDGQWRDRSPGQNYRWLRDGPGLHPLGEQQGYTLFRVGVSR